jgi:hypothetical protein
MDKSRNSSRMMQPSCDVVLLKKHKLSGVNAPDFDRKIWTDAAYFILDADPEYTLSSNGAGRRGVCILISLHIKHLVECVGLLHDNRSMWATPTRFPLSRINILTPKHQWRTLWLFAVLNRLLQMQ